jgi:formyltetrahydrofolate hydrolase
VIVAIIAISLLPVFIRLAAAPQGRRMIAVVILISGRGSNLASLLAATASGALPARIVGVLANRADAAGLQTAARHGIPTGVVDHRLFAERDQFDARWPRRSTASPRIWFSSPASCEFSATPSFVATGAD